MKLTCKVLLESGRYEGLWGLSLSYEQPLEKMADVANKMVLAGDSHAKFLESMVVWMDIKAPRFWWQQFDTYRVGVTKQSGSTMHNMMKNGMTQEDFDDTIPDAWLTYMNELLAQGKFLTMKNLLPEGYLQRRMVCVNYKTLAHIYEQRRNHRLPHWQAFFAQLLPQLQNPNDIVNYGKKDRLAGTKFAEGVV